MKKYSNISILLIEDEDYDVRRVENTVKIFSDLIEIKEVVSNGSDAIDMLKTNPDKFHLVIMDYQIAGSLKGEYLIKEIKKASPFIQVIVITKHTINITDFDFANRLLEAGAFWYCTKYPGDIEEYIYQPTDFLISVFNAYEKRMLEISSRNSNKKLARNVEEILERKKIIGSSSDTNEILRQIQKLAKNDVNILIVGPSGTGKELIANNIHYNSDRKFENFVPINCGGLPADLIESELFGYEKGAFTGANRSKPGLFEVADKGSIFLDEVAELPLNSQVKLLRVLQDGEIEKIGRTNKIKVDVRVIAASNKNIRDEIRNGKFREDLYYRLNVVPLFIPPLNKRKQDVPDLLDYYLEFYSKDMGMETPKISEEAREFLMNYSWPGNVRELKNLVQRLLFYSDENIELELVKKSVFGQILSSKEYGGGIFNFSNLDNVETIKELEKKFRKQYFEYVRNNSSSDSEAAKKLGLAPPNYHRMSKELGLK